MLVKVDQTDMLITILCGLYANNIVKILIIMWCANKSLRIVKKLISKTLPHIKFILYSSSIWTKFKA